MAKAIFTVISKFDVSVVDLRDQVLRIVRVGGRAGADAGRIASRIVVLRTELALQILPAEALRPNGVARRRPCRWRLRCFSSVAICQLDLVVLPFNCAVFLLFSKKA